MVHSAVSLRLVRGDMRTLLLVTEKQSVGPSGHEAFSYIEPPKTPHPSVEIDPAALYSEDSLKEFLGGLIVGGDSEVTAWILSSRLPRLRALLKLPADAGPHVVQV
ncbi:MAG TPA: hypothetical protein VNE62_03805 [Actinomycetota bacterium]|nr:hypothetical protein [Actinomycetota bacterium]